VLIPGVICEISVGLGSSPRPRSLSCKVAFPSWAVRGTVRGVGRDGKEGRGPEHTVMGLVFLGGVRARPNACVLGKVVTFGVQQEVDVGLLSGLEGEIWRFVGLFWRYRALLRPWVSLGKDVGLLGDAGQGTTASGRQGRKD